MQEVYKTKKKNDIPSSDMLPDFFLLSASFSPGKKRGLTVIMLQPEVMLPIQGTAHMNTGPSDMYIFVTFYDQLNKCSTTVTSTINDFSSI